MHLFKVLSLVFFLISCSVSTNHFSDSQERGFYFKMKKNFSQIQIGNYQIKVPKKVSKNGIATIGIKSNNEEEMKRIISTSQYEQIQNIIKKDDRPLTSEEQGTILSILNLK